MSTSTPLAGRSTGTGRTVVGICFAAIVFDGYDLIVYGSVVPALLEHPDWDLTPQQVGVIGSYALLGMFLGAITAGTLADRFGRRKLFIGCVVLFSLMMLAVAAAPNPAMLGLARFLAGLGFGGLAPTAIALVVESVEPRRRNLLNAVMLCGFPVGGVLAGLLGAMLLEPLGFRALFALGGLALVTLVPLAFWKLPESPGFVPGAAAARPAHNERLRGARTLVAITLFALANVCGFLLVYGLNTWLPQLMRQGGYALGPAIAFLIVFNLGGIAGAVAGSVLADRHGGRSVAGGAFLIGVVAIGALTTPLPPVILYAVIAVAGAASVGTQIILFGYVATYFHARTRATALGVSTGVGRLGAVAGPIVGGYLVGSGLGLGWNFGFFAAVALLGGLAALAVPPRRSLSAVGNESPSDGAAELPPKASMS